MDQKQLLLDIAMNCTRIGNWAADDYSGKKKRIDTFLHQTNEYVGQIDHSLSHEITKKTLEKFVLEFRQLQQEAKSTPHDTLFWAEKMMTWGNILTHRASFIS